MITQKNLLDAANDILKKSIELASEKGALNWLTVLPLEEFSFSFHKTAFHHKCFFSTYNFQSISSMGKSGLTI